MRITTGELEIFESGIARTGLKPSIKFEFESFLVEFLFISDDGKTRVEFEINEDGKGLSAHLFNYESTDGCGIAIPIRIGTRHGRELWLAYEAKKVSKEFDSWILEYFFMYGKKVY